MVGGELGEGGAVRGEVDVGLVHDDDAVPGRVGEDLLDVGFGEQGAGGVARGAEVDELDAVVAVGEGGGDGGDVNGKVGRGEKRDLNEADVVDGGGDGVHAVRRGADENGVAAGDAEAAQQGVDGLVAADADEQVIRRDGARRVVVGVSEVAEELLELALVRVRVAVQAQEVDGLGGGGPGGERGVWKGRAVGILVGVEEDICAVVFVVTVGRGSG